MQICYIADARSPIAKSWISHFVACKHEITVISSYRCKPDEVPGARVIEFPIVGNSLFANSTHASSATGRLSLLRRLASELHSGTISRHAHAFRAWMAPTRIQHKKTRLAGLIRDLQPDLVHAMRLPYEGFLAAEAVGAVPLLISIWGNDFTLFADRHPALGRLADSALLRADGLHCDCNRDLKLARARGFSLGKPGRVLPGGGGVQAEYYFKVQPDYDFLKSFRIPQGIPLVINPRGPRSYVRNDIFFRAIPLVLKHIPNTIFVAPALAGNPVAEHWVRKLKISASVRLLPAIDREQLASLFAASQISVSPSSHDGTPNTLLEAMAYGAFPIAGDLESLREWITPGENGFLCNPLDPESLASHIIRAIRDEELRSKAKRINRDLICTRADYRKTMTEAESLYEEIVARIAYRCGAAPAEMLSESQIPGTMSAAR